MDNKVSIIKMVKSVGSKIELAKTIITVSICFSNIKLSDTEITILAYFMVYGINQQSKNLIVKSSICKSLANIKTIMVKLKKLELIYKDDITGKVCVTPSLNVDLTPTIGIYLKVDNKL